LKAGERGPTLLEDFIFRQKIQRFDHERVSISCLLWRKGASFTDIN
jgi:catalase